MGTREKRNITIDIHVNGEYTRSAQRDNLTARQAIVLGKQIAKNYARGNSNHIMVFVHFGELAIAHMTARTEQVAPTYRKHIALDARTYNI